MILHRAERSSVALLSHSLFKKGVLRAVEDKERDKAAKKITQVLENAADTASKNEVIMERPGDR